MDGHDHREKVERITDAVALAIASVLFLVMIAAATAEPLPIEKRGACPAGYRESGGFCAPTSDRSRPALSKRGGQCPSNWVQSGSYCIRIAKERH